MQLPASLKHAGLLVLGTAALLFLCQHLFFLQGAEPGDGQHTNTEDTEWELPFC